MRHGICLMMILLATLSFGQAPAQSPVPVPVPVPRPLPLCLPNPCSPNDTSPPLLRIGLVADPQYCDQSPFRGRYYRLAPEKLREAIDTFNVWKVDFVVNLGDIVDGGEESFKGIRPIYQRLQAPEYNVLGNHEFWKMPAELKSTIRDSLGMTANYCSFQAKGMRFILLDGTELAAYASEAHPDLAEEGGALWDAVQGKARGKVWNGGIGREQREWLHDQLAESAFLAEPAIIFCHFPIMPADHHSNLWNDLEMRTLIESYPNVVAWIAGHYHDGNYYQRREIHHLTLRGMVMTPDSNAFSVMDIYPDRLEINGFGREPYRRLPFRTAVNCEEISYPPQPAFDSPAPGPVPEPSCIERSFVDLMGRVRHRDEMADSSRIFAPADALPPGLYWLRFGYPAEQPSRLVPVLGGAD